MHVAIYCRKSTDDSKEKSAEMISTAQQEIGAREFAASKNWTVVDVFIDDKKSGAEFERRPGLMKLMAALDPVAPFSVLLVRDSARLGRESSQTAYLIKQLSEKGVEVISYADGKSLTPKNYLEKMMFGFQAGADEAHREQSSLRVHESHTRKHKAGYVVGGRCFGYTNRHVGTTDAHGNFLKSHTTRVIDPVEAAVVRRIFEMFDRGLGLKRIAKILTTENAPTPKPFNDPNGGLRPCTGWSPSTVRAVLCRTTYHGEIIWNKSRKKNSWGKKQITARPSSEWVRTFDESLRIVPEPLWQRVAARRAETEGKAIRFSSGRISGRPPLHATVNLLAGLATCGVCGGGLIIEHSNNRKGKYSYYVCHRRRTASTCTNTLRMPIEDMNEAVLHAIEEHALTPEAIESVILSTERDDATEARVILEAEQIEVRKRIARLVDAIAAGADALSLVTKVRELESRQAEIGRALAQVRPVPRLAPAIVIDRLGEWRRLLRASTTQARMVIQRVIRGRVTFTPRTHPITGEVDGYDFSADTRFDKLFSGIAVERPAFIPGSNAGAEGIHASDTLDADYGKLLETAVMRKGWCARQVSNLRPPV